MSKQSRGVVEQDYVEQGAGDFPSQVRCKMSDSLSTIRVGHAPVDEHRDVEIGLLSGLAACPAAEEKSEPDRREL
jgi:hypothetical protein